MSFSGLHTNLNMMLNNMEAKEYKDVLEKICGIALEAGYIDDTFLTHLLKREEEYPTGLPTSIPIAIPHVHDGCKQSFFAVAKLTNPVEFRCMGEPDEKVNTELVFLFGITDPSYQTDVLKKFSVMFTNEDELKKCADTKNSDELLIFFEELFGDYIIV